MLVRVPSPTTPERAAAIEAVKESLTRCLSALDVLGFDRAAIRVDEAIWLLNPPHEQGTITAIVDAELREWFG